MTEHISADNAKPCDGCIYINIHIHKGTKNIWDLRN